MGEKKYRIGIDVGGTFTDAVVIDNETYEIIGKEKIPTTHNAKEGVAKGIIDIIQKIIINNNINADDIIFIAHGTTQATNALLEGDVSPVGIIAIGTGIESIKSKSETQIGDIELAKGKFLKTEHAFIDSKGLNEKENEIKDLIKRFKENGIGTIVSTEAYSVDNPENEEKVLEVGRKLGYYGTASHEISKLYGLKTRTRTAVINGSIIPRMMETANMTESSVIDAGIKSPLMIMRCDGGVMTIDEVRKRPILTMLSGPAAGVAGVLMYEKVSDGIFFEVGGTSTDISVVKNGKVMVKYAEIGGHKTYLNSLDVRTLGIAGGSMIKVKNGKIVDVGPRSAHIAGLDYEVFAREEDMKEPKLKYISPREGDDKNYAVIETSNGKVFSLTLAGAANVAGMVPEGDYARGNVDVAIKAFEVLAKELNLTVNEVANQILKVAISKVKKVVDELKEEYDLSENIINLVGGGGSASIVVPFLAKETGYKFTISKNAPYISTIGVALAMIRDVVERTIPNPTNDDIRLIRKEALESAVRSGAKADTVEVTVNIDKKKNIIRAIATGATELRTKDLGSKKLDNKELADIASKSMNISQENIYLDSEVGNWKIFKGEIVKKRLFGLIKSKKTPVRVLDCDGVLRLQKNWGKSCITNGAEINKTLETFIDENTKYGDGGSEIPSTYVFLGHRMIDLSGLSQKEQMISLVEMELSDAQQDEKIVILVSR
ncbi:hydantoinase/oxoprolinase family protein [Abyssisolibacter fermentans]|uniref:hydantoinase/oxoprolinase family protein n=1 Tax=Abyssisolibacter fermentans TaxID=1766203 RepID=UPI00082EE132|nr:hydantoinase/oxoprolinase family protein [Abyssisolibacter fermentans]